MKLLILAFAAATAHAAYNAPLFTLNEKDIIGGLRCRKEVTSVLRDWKFTGEWSKHLSHAENDGVILLSPTKTFASWVSLNIVNAEVSMELVRPMAVKRITFTKDCLAQTEVQFPKPQYSLTGRFTDEAVKKFMEQNPKGIFYVWSANMPWSVEGIAHVRAAAKEFNVPVKVVMSPLSDRGLTEKLLKEKKITKEETQSYASLEFVMRGMSLHDPSILTFKHGRLGRWARPGRESKAVLKREFAGEFQ